MRKLFLNILFVGILGGIISLPQFVMGQCGASANNSGSLSPSASWQTLGCARGDEYYTFTATAGVTYSFSFCRGGGVQPGTWLNSQITILDNSGTPMAGGYSDFGCSGFTADLDWTAPSSGTFRVQINDFFCASNANCATMAYMACAPATIGADCATPHVVGGLPFSQSGLSTCGSGNNFNSGMACGSLYMDGNDYVFSYTATGSECLNISLSNTDSWVGLFVLDGCPSAGGTNCIASNESGAGNPSLSGVTLPGAGTYYFVVSTLPPPDFTPFDIDIESCATGGDCSAPRVIGSLPYSESGLTTAGFGDDFSSSDACGNAFMDGDDFVFSYTSAGSECIDIFLSGTNNSTGIFWLDGCPNTASTNCLASDTRVFGNPSLTGLNIGAAGTYYLVVSTNPSPQNTPFNIQVDTCQPPTPCGTNPPAADSCIVAPDVSGYPSFCGQTTNNPYTPDVPGNLNSVFCGVIDNNSWFKFRADSVNAIFNFTVGPCVLGQGIQAMVFSASSCATFTGVSNCFNPGTMTSGTVAATGLTVGQTYYLMVDGQASDDCQYTVSYNGGLLPVEFGELSLRAEALDYRLDWATYSEANADYFSIQGGTPATEGENGAISWREIGRELAAGYSNELKTYSATIGKLEMEAYEFLRIREVDFDGYSTFSDVIAVNASGTSPQLYHSVFPNPFGDQLHIEFDQPEAGDATFSLYSVTGAKVLFRHLPAGAGPKKSHSLQLNSIPAGVYSYQIQAGSKLFTGILVCSR